MARAPRQDKHEKWSQALQMGLSALGDGAFLEALNHFETAHLLAPDQPLVQYALGRELARGGDFAAAKTLLRQAWATDPTLVGAAATLARGLGLEERDFDAATEVLDAASAPGIELATLDIVRGELYVERGDFARAREAAAAAIADDDSEAVALGAEAIRVRADNLEGVALAANDDHETALFYFRRAQVGDPLWAAPHINMALAFEAIGRERAALTAVEEALAVDPDNPEAIALHARLLFALGRDGEATSELATAFQAHPEATGLAVMLAEMCAAGGDVDTAAVILTDLLAQDPTDAQAWLTLGRAQLGANAIGAAEECLRQALELAPDNLDALTLLADLLVRDGRFFEAAALAKKAEGLAPPPSSRYLRGSQSPRFGPRPGRRS